MPFVARWPGRIPAGTSIDKLTQNIDFAPTFLDAAGVATPADMHGASLLPLLRGKKSDWRQSIYYHYYEEGEHNVPAHEGVRGERFKLIHFYTRNTWEFYDLENDPQEMVNQYQNPDYSEQVQQLYAELERLKKLYNAPDVKSN